ncbi:hypothetical protein BpHYR1_010414 [Brachionus plicatilis]|uniref:Uncharacterized protein n=1 Tax=Brachionus plicatilis TaxID=10195 RepID=A0A3M7T2G3_BRAPC|nr:hypothetical protein BpHYR1_010414 [Brachionus plicatilis]
MQVIQNSAVRSILKLKYGTPSNIMHQEVFNKLKLLTREISSGKIESFCSTGRQTGRRIERRFRIKIYRISNSIVSISSVSKCNHVTERKD